MAQNRYIDLLTAPAPIASTKIDEAIVIALHKAFRAGDEREMSAAALRKELVAAGLSVSRKDVNSTLYRILKPAGVVDFTRQDGKPIWHLTDAFLNALTEPPPPSPPKESEVGDGMTVVMLDLGNVHDALVPAAQLLEGAPGSFLLKAYADPGCNAPGMAEHSQYVVRATSSLPNAADVMLIMDATRILTESSGVEMLIASNDRLLATFAELASDEYPSSEVTLLPGNKVWDELREYIE